MQCQNHPKKEAVGACVNCGNFFCADCLIKVKNKNYCKICAAELLGDTEKRKTRLTESQPIVFQQQQQQMTEPAQATPSTAPYNWQPIKTLVKWVIGIFLIFAAFGQFFQKFYFSGILSLLLGVYWMPPAQDALHRILKEKYRLVIPTWTRNLFSLVLFFVMALSKF